MEVREITKGVYGVFAMRDVKEKTPLRLFKPTYVEGPTRTSIQINDKHFEDPIGQYLNHCCNPNTRVSLIAGTSSIVLVATENIKRGDEITFDYRTTETKLNNPFKCGCHGEWVK